MDEGNCRDVTPWRLHDYRMMVFAVSLMVAMVMHMNMTEVFRQEDFTIVKNPTWRL